MIRFLDGPAAGVVLWLKRAPVLLRAVEHHGKWDGLDQIEDDPQPGESVHVYVRSSAVRAVHVSRRSGGGGVYPMADYRYASRQPGGEHGRDRAKWRQWCRDSVGNCLLGA